MGLPQAQAPFSVADYLDWEREQRTKSEFLHGEAFAMGGASRRHVTITLNVASDLMDGLSGTPCGVYAADMKLRVPEGEAYFYPDVLVTCDGDDHKADLFMSAPAVVIAGLSPSTAAFDRGDRFAACRRIPSLREFVLIDPDRRQIELYRRGAGDFWELHDIAPGHALRLASLEAEIEWDRIFRNLD